MISIRIEGEFVMSGTRVGRCVTLITIALLLSVNAGRTVEEPLVKDSAVGELNVQATTPGPAAEELPASHNHEPIAQVRTLRRLPRRSGSRRSRW